MKAGNTLYIVDAAVRYNRRLLEQISIVYSAVNAFNLAFVVGSTSYDIHSALSMSGYVGSLPVEFLSLIFWAEYAHRTQISRRVNWLFPRGSSTSPLQP